jgi:hypothetical protein
VAGIWINPNASTACILSFFFHPLDFESEKKDFVLVFLVHANATTKFSPLNLYSKATDTEKVNSLKFQINPVACRIIFYGTGDRSTGEGGLTRDSHNSSQWISLAMEGRSGWNRT